ncbi:NifB/NifX family molybdenum-iron cluster-binding protein [Halarcobacter anaerophilus]|jgi:predicted Fe-Mo cluster-binding NifX family protein|uniref:Dinitrogenase iron-molybdenum cofactor biosynthesis protein n=1 Tax=Halarcobacter anaerophilus TaxID=877500 RepID=A0A4V1LQA0_9BACT|nr:NifB/NifX family molybdenum-iron cluster-binding protein [Halarcobacter anaerophilus]QDF27618.1 [Fe-Mo] cluster-binding protein, NifX/NifB/NifY family [Halarcobacter anaerophilus]RXJ63968.1 dinitrogenase iron-molybdenum cofactor biosynthesis protein [Halarcobacter anaerophilus]
MIAIPLNKSSSTTISDLYGNAPYFALLNPTTGSFTVEENIGCGNGLDTAKFVKDLGVTSTIFFHMGEGVFNYLNENEIKVFSATKMYLSIEDIYRSLLENSCKIVTKHNCESLLDPGTASCACECEDRS